MNDMVSVVLATYNTERFVRRAIESVLAQSYRNLELIIVDDGSTDGTRARIASCLDDPRVRYVYQPNAGQPAADNHGIALARGGLIAFIDADDMWMTHKLERQVPLFARPETGVVYAPVIRIDEHDRPAALDQTRRYSGKITERLFVENVVPFSSSVVRRSCFERAGLFDTTLRTSYDYDLWLRISTEFEFMAIDEPLAFYRTWSGQMTHRHFRLIYENGMHIMRRFHAAHPDAVSRAAAREAWAHTYVGRAHFIRRYEHSALGAFADYVRALAISPCHLAAYKGIAEMIARPQWRS